MKNIKIITLVLLTFMIISCEDVVNIPLKSATPELVVDATLQWEKGTAGNNQTIYLSQTTPFYNTTTTKVSGAVVVVIDAVSQQIFNFVEGTAGAYVCSNFVPVLNHQYKLQINYNNQTYEATELLADVPVIKRIEQRNAGGFSGKDKEVKFFFDDIQNQKNFYRVKFEDANFKIPEIDVLRDEFFQNNEMFGLYSNEDLETNDVVKLQLATISEKNYNYLNKLLSIAGANGGSPFQSPPSTVRGNVVNLNNNNNNALGFFSIIATQTLSVTIQ